MIKKYKFNYDMFRAEACFTVDTEKFTEEHAKATLEFFSWDYDKDANQIDEVLKKYALEVIRVATEYDWNAAGVITQFENKEGYASIDGSVGITITYVEGFEFEQEGLSVEITTE